MAVVDQAARAKEAGAPKYAQKAWLFLDREAFPRKQCIWLVEQAWFDHCILGLIAANCLTMMVRLPPTPPPPTLACRPHAGLPPQLRSPLEAPASAAQWSETAQRERLTCVGMHARACACLSFCVCSRRSC